MAKKRARKRGPRGSYLTGPLWKHVIDQRREAIAFWTTEAIVKRAGIAEWAFRAAMKRRRVVTRAEAQRIARALRLPEDRVAKHLVIDDGAAAA